MSREQIITVYEVPNAVEGDPYIRVPITADKDPSTMRVDRETGEFITLWEEKLRFPYKTKVNSKLCVITNSRVLTFKLVMDKDGSFIWNGQNIISPLWSLLRISKHSPEGLQASKWHDSLIQYKEYYINLLREEYKDLGAPEYRRITSLIFRQLLINNGVSKWKAYTMAWFVDQWQKLRFFLAGIK